MVYLELRTTGSEIATAMQNDTHEIASLFDELKDLMNESTMEDVADSIIDKDEVAAFCIKLADAINAT